MPKIGLFIGFELVVFYLIAKYRKDLLKFSDLREDYLSINSVVFVYSPITKENEILEVEKNFIAL